MVDKVSIPASAPAAPAAPTSSPEIAVSAIPGKPLGVVTNQAGQTGFNGRIEIGPNGTPAMPEDRPAWLPEKFKSPADMAAAYTELERRMGAGQPAPAAPQAAPAPHTARMPEGAAPAAPGAPAAADLVAKMTQEYAQSGGVTPETRQEFIQRTGLPDSFVDQQIAYMKSREQSTLQMAVQRLGGEGAVRELQEWAATSLSAADRQAFNRAVYSDDPALAQLALDGLAAQYESKVGRAPRIIAGRRPQEQFRGAVPYQSHEEWRTEMKDPRYKADPAFRQRVEERLSASMQLGIL